MHRSLQDRQRRPGLRDRASATAARPACRSRAGGPLRLLRSTAPVALAAAAVIFFATASISGSVSVWSGACRRTATASDFVPAPSPAARRRRTARPRGSAPCRRPAPRPAGSRPATSSATTKAKSRSTGWNGEALSGGRERADLLLGLGRRSRNTSKPTARPVDALRPQDRRVELAELGEHGLRPEHQPAAAAGVVVAGPSATTRSASSLILHAASTACASARASKASTGRGAAAQWRSWSARPACPPATTSCSPGCGAEEARPDLEQRDPARPRGSGCARPRSTGWASRLGRITESSALIGLRRRAGVAAETARERRLGERPGDRLGEAARRRARGAPARAGAAPG